MKIVGRQEEAKLHQSSLFRWQLCPLVAVYSRRDIYFCTQIKERAKAVGPSGAAPPRGTARRLRLFAQRSVNMRSSGR